MSNPQDLEELLQDYQNKVPMRIHMFAIRNLDHVPQAMKIYYFHETKDKNGKVHKYDELVKYLDSHLLPDVRFQPKAFNDAKLTITVNRESDRLVWDNYIFYNRDAYQFAKSYLQGEQNIVLMDEVRSGARSPRLTLSPRLQTTGVNATPLTVAPAVSLSPVAISNLPPSIPPSSISRSRPPTTTSLRGSIPQEVLPSRQSLTRGLTPLEETAVLAAAIEGAKVGAAAEVENLIDERNTYSSRRKPSNYSRRLQGRSQTSL